MTGLKKTGEGPSSPIHRTVPPEEPTNRFADVLYDRAVDSPRTDTRLGALPSHRPEREWKVVNGGLRGSCLVGTSGLSPGPPKGSPTYGVSVTDLTHTGDAEMTPMVVRRSRESG